MIKKLICQCDYWTSSFYTVLGLSTDQWLEEFTFNNRHLEEAEKTPSEVFNEFTIWKDTNEFRYDINKQKFRMKLNIIASNCITKGEHTRFDDKKKFNITKLKLKYDIQT